MATTAEKPTTEQPTIAIDEVAEPDVPRRAGPTLGGWAIRAAVVILGLVALRVRGLYFALITLAWGFVGENSIFRIRSFTGGGAGQKAPRPTGFISDRGFLLICVIALSLILLIDWRLVATKAGRAL